MPILNYDESGFIIGNDRLEKGLKSINDDTQEIIRILTSQNQIANTKLTQIVRNTERLNHSVNRSRLSNQARSMSGPNSNANNSGGQSSNRQSNSNQSDRPDPLRGARRNAPPASNRGQGNRDSANSDSDSSDSNS
ncbi:MAG: hypothetical protein Q4P13_10685, partial [Psychrobacter sp.]|nr:hypothetical protein [Psychrobacter sp.]